MRTEKKLQNGNVIVVFDSFCGSVSIRPSGKINKDEYEDLITVDVEHNKFIFNRNVAGKYGITLSIV